MCSKEIWKRQEEMVAAIDKQIVFAKLLVPPPYSKFHSNFVTYITLLHLFIVAHVRFVLFCFLKKAHMAESFNH